MDMERYARTRLLLAPELEEIAATANLSAARLRGLSISSSWRAALGRQWLSLSLPLLQESFQRNGHRARAALPQHSVAR